MAVQVFGIRHHGPGSARSLLTAFEQMRPDVVLVEGPVEGTGQIHWLGEAQIEPPVALLVYRPDVPLESSFYPFASFSPEWNALRWAVRNGVEARFIDLPKTNWMALPREAFEEAEEEDPLRTMARLAGYRDFEPWWDRLVEERGEVSVFAAVYEAMVALRQGRPLGALEKLREASMRQQIRAAMKEGFTRIAVVCGAWHSPALVTMPPMKDDAAALKGLPKVKVEVSWVPWTHGRLRKASGYGAGIESPGWYAHLWATPEEPAIPWVAKVAQLLRAEDLDASPAQVVETVRLAETLASLRGRRLTGLAELNDAVETVLLFGDRTPLKLIDQKLIVGETLGTVPPEVSTVPLQRDLETQQKRLRLKPEVAFRVLNLDLRKENDRARSQLLHRLRLLNVNWGWLMQVGGKMGTFHEAWELEWKPEFSIEIITAARWGNTVETAAAERARVAAMEAKQLPQVTALLEPVLKAGLPDAAPAVLLRLRDVAALAPDVVELLKAVPPMVRITRYGDVRQTDRELVGQVAAELIARACVGLPVACGSLDDEAARGMKNAVAEMHEAILVLNEDGLREMWRESLERVVGLPDIHGLVLGGVCRLLYDMGEMDGEELTRKASQALSPGTAALDGAAWLEGFLERSGGVLLVNTALWELVNGWVEGLRPESFEELLPLLRRTFATFAKGERRQLGERARRGMEKGEGAEWMVDTERAGRVMGLLRVIYG